MGIKGKYFLIVSKATGYALDIEGASQNPGARVILWDRHGNNNQIWYEDPVTGTIRSKANTNLCLDINGAGRLCTGNYQPGNANQQWHWNKGRNTFENRTNTNKVFDVVGESRSKGAEVCSWDYHGRENQQWKIEPQPARYFYIISELSGKVLDIEGGSKSSGAKVITYPKKGGHADNQLWFEDCYGNIRSKLEEKRCFDCGDGTLRTGDFAEHKKTFWCVHGNKIVNRSNPNEVLDIKGNNAGDCAELCAWNYHGGANQHWRFEYIN